MKILDKLTAIIFTPEKKSLFVRTQLKEISRQSQTSTRVMQHLTPSHIVLKIKNNKNGKILKVGIPLKSDDDLEVSLLEKATDIVANIGNLYDGKTYKIKSWREFIDIFEDPEKYNGLKLWYGEEPLNYESVKPIAERMYSATDKPSSGSLLFGIVEEIVSVHCNNGYCLITLLLYDVNEEIQLNITEQQVTTFKPERIVLINSKRNSCCATWSTVKKTVCFESAEYKSLQKRYKEMKAVTLSQKETEV